MMAHGWSGLTDLHPETNTEKVIKSILLEQLLFKQSCRFYFTCLTAHIGKENSSPWQKKK